MPTFFKRYSFLIFYIIYFLMGFLLSILLPYAVAKFTLPTQVESPMAQNGYAFQDIQIEAGTANWYGLSKKDSASLFLSTYLGPTLLSNYSLPDNIHQGTKIRVRFPPLYAQSSIFLSFDENAAYMHQYGNSTSTYRVGQTCLHGFQIFNACVNDQQTVLFLLKDTNSGVFLVALVSQDQFIYRKQITSANPNYDDMLCNDSKAFLTFGNQLLVIDQAFPLQTILEQGLTSSDPYSISMDIQNNKLLVADGNQLRSYIFQGHTIINSSTKTLNYASTAISSYLPDYLLMINRDTLFQVDQSLNRIIFDFPLTLVTDDNYIKLIGDSVIVYPNIFMIGPVPFVSIYSVTRTYNIDVSREVCDDTYVADIYGAGADVCIKKGYEAVQNQSQTLNETNQTNNSSNSSTDPTNQTISLPEQGNANISVSSNSSIDILDSKLYEIFKNLKNENSSEMQSACSAASNVMVVSSFKISPQFLLSLTFVFDDLWEYRYRQHQYSQSVQFFVEKVDVIQRDRLNPMVISVIDVLNAKTYYGITENERMINQLQVQAFREQDIFFLRSFLENYRSNILLMLLTCLLFKIFQAVFALAKRAIPSHRKRLSMVSKFFSRNSQWWIIVCSIIETNISRIAFDFGLQLLSPSSRSAQQIVNMAVCVLTFYVLVFYICVFYPIILSQMRKKEAKIVLSPCKHQTKSYIYRPSFVLVRLLLRSFCHSFLIHNFYVQILTLSIMDIIFIWICFKMRHLFFNCFIFSFYFIYMIAFFLYDSYFFIQFSKMFPIQRYLKKQLFGLGILGIIVACSILVSITFLISSLRSMARFFSSKVGSNSKSKQLKVRKQLKINNVENLNKSLKAQNTFNTRRQNIGHQLKEEPFKQAIKLMVKTQSSLKTNMPHQTYKNPQFPIKKHKKKQQNIRFQSSCQIQVSLCIFKQCELKANSTIIDLCMLLICFYYHFCYFYCHILTKIETYINNNFIKLPIAQDIMETTVQRSKSFKALSMAQPIRKDIQQTLNQLEQEKRKYLAADREQTLLKQQMNRKREQLNKLKAQVPNTEVDEKRTSQTNLKLRSTDRTYENTLGNIQNLKDEIDKARKRVSKLKIYNEQLHNDQVNLSNNVDSLVQKIVEKQRSNDQLKMQIVNYRDLNIKNLTQFRKSHMNLTKSNFKQENQRRKFAVSTRTFLGQQHRQSRVVHYDKISDALKKSGIATNEGKADILADSVPIAKARVNLLIHKNKQKMKIAENYMKFGQGLENLFNIIKQYKGRDDVDYLAEEFVKKEKQIQKLGQYIGKLQYRIIVEKRNLQKKEHVEDQLQKQLTADNHNVSEKHYKEMSKFLKEEIEQLKAEHTKMNEWLKKVGDILCPLAGDQDFSRGNAVNVIGRLQQKLSINKAQMGQKKQSPTKVQPAPPIQPEQHHQKYAELLSYQKMKEYADEYIKNKKNG